MTHHSFWLRTLPLVVLLVGSQLFVLASSAQAATASIQTETNPYSIGTNAYPALTHKSAAVDAAISINTFKSSYRVGNTVSYITKVATTAASSMLTGINTIDVTILLPFGLINVTANGGSTWSINSSSITSPTLITASYIGSYPITPGTTLPFMTITGIVGASAATPYQVIASLFIPGDNNSANDTSTYTFAVLPPIAMYGTINAGISLTASRTSYKVGDPALYTVRVATTDASSILAADTSINVTILLPVGLTDIIANSSSIWSISSSATTSPSLITASYRGSYPIVSGSMLRPINISGRINAPAGTTYTSTANLTVAGDNNSANDVSISTFTVNAPNAHIKIPLKAHTPIHLIQSKGKRSPT